MFRVKSLGHPFQTTFTNLESMQKFFMFGDTPTPRPAGTRYRVSGPDFSVIVTYRAAH